ncbi:hypothetical protein JCM10207_004222 [Rhodosporidiobolus poonsookiae]
MASYPLPALLSALPKVGIYLLVLCATLVVFLPLFLRLFILPRGLSIGHFSLFAIHNFRWVAPPSPSDPKAPENARLNVNVGKIRLARWGGGGGIGGKLKLSRGSRGAWFVLRLEDVKVRVPKAFALQPRTKGSKSTPHPAPPSTSSSSEPSSRRSSVSSGLHLDTDSQPASSRSSRLRALAQRLTGLLTLFAIHISFTVEVEDVAFLSGSISAGGEVRPATSDCPAETLDGGTAHGWVRLERLEVRELPRGLEKKLDGPESRALPALDMPEGVVVKVEAPLVAPPEGGLKVRPGGIRLAIEFGGDEPPDVAAAARTAAKGVRGTVKDQVKRHVRERRSSHRGARGREASEGGELQGLHLRVHELKRIMLSLEELAVERDQRAALAGEAQPEPSKPAQKASPLAHFRSISLSLPSIVLSAHYHTPLHILAGSSLSPDRPLPETIAFALSVAGVSASVQVGGSSDEEWVRKEHKEWIGKGREVAVGGFVEWREVEGRVKVDGDEQEILRNAAKTLSIGPSRVDICSTWLPPSLAPSSSPSSPLSPQNPSQMPAPVYHNDATLIIEGFLGQIRGHAPFETLDSALRIFKARPRSSHPSSPRSRRQSTNTRADSAAPPQHPAHQAQGPPSPPKRRIYALPRIVGTLASAGVELRVQAPQPVTSAVRQQDSPDPSASPMLNGDPTDPFFRTWGSPELLCVSLPAGQVSFAGEYVDRSVRRTEADRRAAKRAAKHRRNESRQSARSLGEEQDGRDGRSRSRSHGRRRDDDDDDDELPISPTKAFEDEFGVPPPPPIGEHSRRKFVPVRPPANTAKDLNTYGLEYSTRFLLTAETLNVYILATNSGGHDEADYTDSEDGWNDSRQAMPALPSDPVRLDVLALGPLELSSNIKFLGDEHVDPIKGFVPYIEPRTSEGEHNFLLETIGIDLWRPVVRGCLRDFLTSFASASSTATPRAASFVQPPPPSASLPKPLVDVLPADQNVYFALSSFDLRIAGTDPKADAHACRGVAVHTGMLVLEYLLPSSYAPGLTGNFAERGALELREDIRVEASASSNPYAAHGAATGLVRPKTALVKLSLTDWSVDPVVDARASRGQKRYMARGDGEGEEEGDDWELRGRAELADLAKRRKSIIPPRYDPRTAGTGKEKQAASSLFVAPHIALRVKIQHAPDDDQEDAPLDEILVNLDTEAVTLRLELFSIYLCLVAISSLRSLKPKVLVTTALKQPRPSRDPPRPPPLVLVRADLGDIHVFPTLPHDTHLYINLRRVRLSQSQAAGLALDFDSALLAGESPTVPGKWEDIVRFQASALSIRPEPGNDGNQPFVVSLSSETARLRIPFRYIFSRIVDNTANLVKATKQLVHEHIKGGQGFILEPEPEEAKRLPKLDLRVGLLAVSFQDDPFETKLNVIWRAGYEEQNARLEREAAFEAKAEAIRRRDANGGTDEESAGEESDDGRPFSRRPKVDGRHSISIDEARRDLLAYNSSHWIKRIRNAAAEQARREETLSRRLYGAKHQNLRPDSRLPIELVPASKSVPLARATFHHLHFVVSKPSFGEDGLADYLHDVGKGLPRDTQFTLLVPLHISWKMDEARFRLRDYPLPLLHVPPGDDPDHAAWELETDLVIAEEVGGKESVRRVPCAVIPQHVFRGQGAPYSIVVPRSAMTVKTYMQPTIRIRTVEPTRIGWGNSVQPAIQDLARVIDTLSKPTPDPSDRLGFWDKIRLQLHWRIHFVFDGPQASVIFHLKGTRDPYALTGFGAGFAKAWKGNVQFRIGFDNPDHEFFQILSDEYILGIPNLRDYIDAAATGAMPREVTADDGRDDRSATGGSARYDDDDDGESFDESNEESHYWIKVCAKCINGVRWGLRLDCERTCRDECTKPGCQEQSTFHRQCRLFDFIPHWQVHTKTKASVGVHGEVADSFAGFRSDFVHFSISLTSPATLDLPGRHDAASDASVDYAGEHGYNSLHFTPSANTHFARWWKTFDGTMSLPIRQGKLFPSAQAPSKKFGKHCATIKYRFSLAPLFISHTYRQENWAEWARGETTVLGLKGKIGRFNVDLHQREQEMSIRRPEMSESKTVKHKAFYMAEIDLDAVDLRTITACFKEPEKAYVAPVDAEAEEGAAPQPDFDKYSASEDDRDWINLNDFNDASYTMPDRQPHLRVLPLMSCPRFTYYRHTGNVPVKETDTDDASDLDHLMPHERAKTKFGKEETHTCLMGHAADAVTVQLRAAQMRLVELEAQLNAATEKSQQDELGLRIRGVNRIIDRLHQLGSDTDAVRPDNDEPSKKSQRSPPTPGTPFTAYSASEDSADASEFPHLFNSLSEDWRNWENRYMIHNPTIHVSNATREVLLKYYYSSQDRKGHIYQVSASVIRFIRDLAKEHERKHRRDWSRRKSQRTGGSTVRKNPAWEDSEQANRLLDQLVNREGGFWAANESQDGGAKHQFGDHLNVDPEQAAASLPEFYDANTGHLCMLYQPQISLQSDIDDKSTLIITAFRAQLRVFSIVDTRILDDPVNSEVLHQTFADLTGLQVFWPRSQNERNRRGLWEYAFVPLETLVDLRVEPWGFDRIVSRTSAALRYDKFNQLRLSSKHGFSDSDLGPASGAESHFHTSTDRLSVECEKFSLSANPRHFAALYNVVTDLILYSDPGRKSRSTKLESLVFTRDFSNLRSVIDTVSTLQQRIRALAALLQEYHLHLDELDDDGRVEQALARAEYNRLSDELGLVVEALTRAQDANGPKTTSKRSGTQLEARAVEITWHMLDKTDLPFAKFSVINAEFSWISKQDGSASNRLVVKDLRALNSSPEQIFAEIIAKHDSAGHDNELAKLDVFAAALWNSLPPVGGISIVESFELHLHPVRLQLEHRIGRKILDYLFSEREQKGDPSGEHPPTSPKPSSLSSPQNSQGSRSVDSLALPRDFQPSSSSLALGRSTNTLASSSASVHSADHRLRKAVSAEVLVPENREEGLDADEMRRRASSNRTFIFVDITSTVLCLTYRSEKEDKSSLPNIYNITYKTPSIQYRSKTWSFLELLDQIKRDALKSVWQQKGQLIGQFLSATHRKLPLADARSAAKQRAVSAVRSRLLKHRGDGKRNEPFIVPSPPTSGRGTPVRRSSFSSSSSDSEGDAADNEHLPFDIGAADLVNPDVGLEDIPQRNVIGHEVFSAEPDELSTLSKEDRPTMSSHSSERSQSSQSSNQFSSGRYPHHEPMRRSTVDLKDDEKRRMLLGKAA